MIVNYLMNTQALRMSLLRKSETPQTLKSLSPNTENNVEPTTNTIVASEHSGDHRLKVLLDTNFTGEQLKKGVTVKLADYMEGAGDNNVIVNGVGTSAIGSNVPASVTTSMNLFNLGEGDGKHYKEAAIKNEKGWLAGDISIDPSTGYQPIANIMPHEYARNETVHYTPKSLMDNALVEKYGKYANSGDLWQGIVPFPGEPYYYLSKDHVVLNIIAKNWEQLGINLPSERLREDKWVKVAASVVDKVIGELQTSVLDNMPFTNLSKLGIHFKSSNTNLENGTRYPLVCEYFIDYNVPSVSSHEGAADEV